MKAWNKKHKPKHWVIGRWNIQFEYDGAVVICLMGKFKPKEHPYPKRRCRQLKYYQRYYEIKILSRKERGKINVEM